MSISCVRFPPESENLRPGSAHMHGVHAPLLQDGLQEAGHAVHPARLARSASPRCFLSLRRNLSMNFIHQFQSVLWSLPNQSVPFLEDPWNHSHLQSQGLSVVQAEFPNCSSANYPCKTCFQITSAQVPRSEHILIKYSTQFKYSHQCRKHPQHLLLPAALKAPQAWTQDSYHTAFLILT